MKIAPSVDPPVVDAVPPVAELSRRAVLRKSAVVASAGVAVGLAAVGIPLARRGRHASSMPTGDLPGWEQVFTDDFTTDVAVGDFPGTAYGARWSGYEGFADTSGHGLYDPGRVLSVTGGLLDFHVHSEGGRHLVAAPVPLFDGAWNSLTYGRYSLRFRADPVVGYKIAVLLWPSDDTWSNGEIDYPEGDLASTFYGASRRAGLGSTVIFDGTRRLATFPAWHIATTEWTPGRIEWFLDGVTVGSTTRDVPTVPMRWTLQAETVIDEPAPADAAAGHIQVDWVTAYRYSPTTG